jgi:predicted ATPase/DNA-binding transcriptional ArsR family regulator
LLLTAAAFELVRDALAIEPVGAHRLKDFPAPEHLPGVASAVALLIEALPDLRILATSQLPLRLETEYALILDALAEGPALELMARVARRRAVTLPIDGPDRDALGEIVRLLDGLPLALELAAARLSLMTPGQLRDRLSESFELLREDRSDRPERQRSLLGTVEWTLGLLDEPARALFTRLGVFAGPVALEEIEAIVGGDGADVLDALPALLDVALVRRVESGDGGIRFGLPEALRQVAVARLDASPDGIAWRRAHAQHFNDVVGAARTVTVPGAVYAAALAADTEAAAALRWARAAGEPMADTLAVSRAIILSEQGHQREALELIDSVGDVSRLDPDTHALAVLSRLYGTLGCAAGRCPRRCGWRAPVSWPGRPRCGHDGGGRAAPHAPTPAEPSGWAGAGFEEGGRGLQGRHAGCRNGGGGEVLDVLGDDGCRAAADARGGGDAGQVGHLLPRCDSLYDACRTLARCTTIVVQAGNRPIMEGAMSITPATEQIAHPTCGELELGAVLHALSDPVRLRIVAELAKGDGEYTCGSFALPVTKSTCTHHFKVLREAGVIQQRQQGTTRLNQLRRADLETRFPGLLDTILQAADSARCGSVGLVASLAARAAAAAGPTLPGPAQLL